MTTRLSFFALALVAPLTAQSFVVPAGTDPAVGTCNAFLFERYNFRFKGLLYVLMLLPLVIPGIVLAMWTVEDPATGTIREAAWVLWPIFGASNQMLAALTLLTLSLYFWRKNKPVWPLAIPMVFIMGITLTSLLAKTMEFYGQKNWLLVGISTVLTTLVLWMLVEAVAVLKGVSNRGADDTPR